MTAALEVKKKWALILLHNFPQNVQIWHGKQRFKFKPFPSKLRSLASPKPNQTNMKPNQNQTNMKPQTCRWSSALARSASAFWWECLLTSWVLKGHCTYEAGQQTREEAVPLLHDRGDSTAVKRTVGTADFRDQRHAVTGLHLKSWPWQRKCRM